MSKLSKILFALWMVLAIVAFVCAFFIMQPFIRVIGVVFGILNLMIVMSWTASLIQARKEYNKQKELEG